MAPTKRRQQGTPRDEAQQLIGDGDRDINGDGYDIRLRRRIGGYPEGGS